METIEMIGVHTSDGGGMDITPEFYINEDGVPTDLMEWIHNNKSKFIAPGSERKGKR